MTDVEEVTIADLDKLLELLQEYTAKLRTICEERIAAQYRRAQTAALLAVVMLTILATIAAFWVSQRGGSNSSVLLPVLLATSGATMAVFFAVATSSLRSRYRRAYDVEQVAATVERLIRLASQYNEHARKRISEQFEFELRLAEAEGALRTYRDLFHGHRVGEREMHAF